VEVQPEKMKRRQLFKAVSLLFFVSCLSLVDSALGRWSSPFKSLLFPQTLMMGKIERMTNDLSCESGLWNVVGGFMARLNPAAQPSQEY
jgi:hypothetical protein